MSFATESQQVNDCEIVSISKIFMSWGDTLELDIKDESNEVIALAVVLSVDAVMDAQAAAN